MRPKLRTKSAPTADNCIMLRTTACGSVEKREMGGALSSIHRFLNQRGDLCLFGGGQLFESV